MTNTENKTGYTKLEIIPVAEYNRNTKDLILKFYLPCKEYIQERKRGYVVHWEHSEGGKGERFCSTKEKAVAEIDKMMPFFKTL
jgi:phosphoribosylamine-glycine ligase